MIQQTETVLFFLEDLLSLTKRTNDLGRDSKNGGLYCNNHSRFADTTRKLKTAEYYYRHLEKVNVIDEVILS